MGNNQEGRLVSLAVVGRLSSKESVFRLGRLSGNLERLSAYKDFLSVGRCQCRSHRTSLTSSKRNSICKTPMRMDSFLKRKSMDCFDINWEESPLSKGWKPYPSVLVRTPKARHYKTLSH